MKPQRRNGIRAGAAALPAAAACAALALLLAGSAGAGLRSTAFADIDPGPRIMAMGGAGVAGVTDPTAAWWNPAGLYFMRGTQGVATYDDLYGLGLVQRNYLGVAVKTVVDEPEFRDNRMSLKRDLDRGTAWGFTLSSLLLELGSDSYSEFMPSVAVAGGLGDDVSLGVSLAYLRAGSSLEATSASGYAAGAGVVCALPAGGRAGLSVRNLVSRVFWKDAAAERLRVTPTFGVSWPVTPRGRVAADMTWLEGNGGPSRISAGGEYWALRDRLAARAGLRRYGAGLQERTVPSFGLGLRWSRVDFDYAFTSDADGPGSTHRFGLNVILSRPE
jgi:hypothetical protein